MAAAKFKYIGHLHGCPAPASGLITVKGLKGASAFNASAFEMQIEPGEIFEIPEDWTMAIKGLEESRHPFQASKLYERVA